MKIIIFILLFFSQALASQDLFTHLKIIDNKVCLKSHSRTKCASDSLTTDQQTALQKKLDTFSNSLPPEIIEDVLNHFWANNHLFTTNQLKELMVNVANVECVNQKNIFNKRKPELIALLNKITEEQRQNDKALVGACVDEDVANKIYREFKNPIIEENSDRLDEDPLNTMPYPSNN